jgi:hypothetical protein
MRMGDENIRGNRTFLEIVAHKPIAQGPDSGTHIHDNQPFIRPNLNAGGIPAKNYRIDPRTGDGTPDSPKSRR